MKNQDEVFQFIVTKIRQSLANRPGPHYAAFDADGTLWDTDLGELFFDYQIHNCGFELPADPWGYYHQTKAVDTPKAYLWLAQINTGTPFFQVRNWAEACFLKNQPYPFLSFSRRLIEFLHSEGVLCYIVTASVKWAVEPAARRLGIPESRVLGITTQIRNGIVTETQGGPITWRQGKAEALLAATGGVRPLLAAGNTLGDKALIETASDVQLAILSQKKGEHLYETELELQSAAQANGWLTLDLSDEH